MDSNLIVIFNFEITDATSATSMFKFSVFKYINSTKSDYISKSSMSETKPPWYKIFRCPFRNFVEKHLDLFCIRMAYYYISCATIWHNLSLLIFKKKFIYIS